MGWIRPVPLQLLNQTRDITYVLIMKEVVLHSKANIKKQQSASAQVTSTAQTLLLQLLYNYEYYYYCAPLAHTTRRAAMTHRCR